MQERNGTANTGFGKAARGCICGVAGCRPAESPIDLSGACSDCHLRELCLPFGVPAELSHALDELSFDRRRLQAGQALYHQGHAFHYIYAIRSGTFKSGVVRPEGGEQVTGLHMTGELLGLDGLAHGHHAITAMALEDSEVCALRYEELTAQVGTNPALQQSLLRLMSLEIVREHTLMVLLGSMNAPQRLTALLLNLSARFAARGYSEREFHLRMSRTEMASYLGMKLETLSRTIAQLQQDGLIAVDRRHVTLLDIDGLNACLRTGTR